MSRSATPAVARAQLKLTMMSKKPKNAAKNRDIAHLFLLQRYTKGEQKSYVIDAELSGGHSTTGQNHGLLARGHDQKGCLISSSPRRPRPASEIPRAATRLPRIERCFPRVILHSFVPHPVPVSPRAKHACHVPAAAVRHGGPRSRPPGLRPWLLVEHLPPPLPVGG